MILAWDNKVDAATVTAGSEIATLPGSNVKTPHLAEKWHTAAGVKSSHLLFDMGSQVACSMLAVLGTNLTPGATFRLRASNTDPNALTGLLLDTGKVSGAVKSGYGAIYRVFGAQYLTPSTAEVPSFAADFTVGVALFGNSAGLTVTRAGAAGTRFDNKGVLEAAVAADSVRHNHDPATLGSKGALIEFGRTNSIRNNSMQGAAAGSPGTAPTNWTVPSSQDGLSRQVVGTGTEDGIDYIDLRFKGTTSAAGHIEVSFDIFAAAANGQYWSLSMYARLVAGTLNGITASALVVEERDGAGVLLAGSQSAFAPTSAKLSSQRPSHTRAFNQAGTARVTHKWDFTYGNGSQIDFTLRIGMPQLEQGGKPSSVIRTTNAVVARNADQVSIASLGNWYDPIVGAVLSECSVEADDLQGVAARTHNIGDGTDNNRIYALINTGGDTVTASMAAGGVEQHSFNLGAYAYGSTARVAHTWAQNDAAVSLNSATPQTDNSMTVPTVDRLQFGQQDGVFLDGHARRFSYFQRRLSNALLQVVPVLVDFQVSARYWRLDIEDLTVPDNLQVGRVFIGSSWKHSGTLKYGWGVTPLDESENDESYGGQDYPEALPKRRVLNFTLDYLTEAEMFDNPFAAARANGSVKDVLAIPHEGGAYVSEQAVWGRLQALKPIVRLAVRIFQTPFTVRERL